MWLQSRNKADTSLGSSRSLAQGSLTLMPVPCMQKKMMFWYCLTWQGQLLAEVTHAFAVLLHGPLHLVHHITGSLHSARF